MKCKRCCTNKLFIGLIFLLFSLWLLSRVNIFDVVLSLLLTFGIMYVFVKIIKYPFFGLLVIILLSFLYPTLLFSLIFFLSLYVILSSFFRIVL